MAEELVSEISVLHAITQHVASRHNSFVSFHRPDIKRLDTDATVDEIELEKLGSEPRLQLRTETSSLSTTGHGRHLTPIPESRVVITPRMRTRARIQFAACCGCLFMSGWNDGTTGSLLPRIQTVYGVSVDSVVSRSLGVDDLIAILQTIDRVCRCFLAFYNGLCGESVCRLIGM